MVIDTIENSNYNQFKLFLFLKATCSGKVRIDSYKRQSIAQILKFKGERSVERYLQLLINREWIGYNPKSKVYFIKAFDKIRRLENFRTRTAAVFSLQDLDKIKAFCSGVLFAYIYKVSLFREKKKKAASHMQNASKPSASSLTFFPIATTGIESLFNISKAKASRLKHLAAQSNYLEFKHQYKDLNIPKEQHKHFLSVAEPNLAEKVVVKEGRIPLQLPDLIYPYITLSYRRKLKT